ESVQLGEMAPDLALRRRVGGVLGGELGEPLLALGLAVLDPGEGGAQRAHLAAPGRHLLEAREALAAALELAVVEIRRRPGERALDRIGLEDEQLVEDVLRGPR